MNRRTLESTAMTTANNTDAGNGSYDIGGVIDAFRSPSACSASLGLHEPLLYDFSSDNKHHFAFV